MSSASEIKTAKAGEGAADEAWLELAMRAADMGAWAWDLDKDEFYISERAAAIFNTRAGTLPAQKGEQLFSHTHPEDLEVLRGAILGAAREGLPYKVEHRSFRVRDPGVMWVLSAGVPVKNGKGRVVKLLGVIQDITARKEAEAQRETLVAELDHRVKNVLASVQSMALQSARKAPSLDGFMRTFAGRLKAMAAAHTLLTTARWRGAEIGHILSAELGGLAPEQAHWDGPRLVLTPRATNALALALHEMATNAVKFGALSSESGRIDIRWRGNAAGGFDLEWTESGGPAPEPPARQGFGATLLNRVTGRELGGEVKLDFAAPGARVRISAGPGAIIDAPGEQVTGPARPAEARAESAPVRPAASGGGDIAGLNVLIVEDSLLLSLELEHGLIAAGARIAGQAAEVAEALAMISPDIDAAILDANLNGESVVPVAEALTKQSTPFVFATGYGDNQMAPQGFDAPFIRKPYDLAQVTAALARVTGRG